MAIIDGYIDWATKQPASPGKTNNLSPNPSYPGPNPVKKVFFHSAEGYMPHLTDLAVNGPLSWHFSIPFDGRLIQHYPLIAKCWHATAANNESIGAEFEGVHTKEKTLTPKQFDTALAILRELASYNQFTPSRPTSPTDINYTCWNHFEVTKLGGSATACPSGRIPWDDLLREFYPQVPQRIFLNGDETWGEERRGKQVILWHNQVEIYKYGSEDGALPGQTWYHAGDNPDGSPRWIKLRD